MGHRESGDVEVRMHPEDPLLILLSHCREMKQQEARLRIITLLLLLSCVSVFVFISCANSTQQRATHQECAAIQAVQVASVSSPTFSVQKNLCSTEDPATTSTATTGPPTARPLRIDLRSLNETQLISGADMQWETTFVGDNSAYNSEHRAIMIPAKGYYFVYMKFVLQWDKQRKDFHVTLRKWNKRYPQNVHLTGAQESAIYSEQKVRTVFVGQLFDLLGGDHLKVQIVKGHELIQKASFGAFQL